MTTHVCTGIDVGTHHVKVVIAQLLNDSPLPRIIGTGISESRGLRHGYIINSDEVTQSVQQAVRQAEKKAGITVKEAFISIGGIGLESIRSKASCSISKGDDEISEDDLQRVVESCEQQIPSPRTQNRRIIHQIPICYRVDNERILGNPLGMKGLKLEADTLFITAFEPHVNDLVDAIENIDIEVIDVMASPLAAGLVTLSKSQKVAGCVLANIGAETVSIVVFENNVPISLETFSIGSSDVTNDIALGLKISLEEAQRIKHGEKHATSISQRKLNEIISARLSDIFELIDAHLKKIHRNQLLPAGAIITGGGSALPEIAERAKTSLELPARVGTIGSSQTSSHEITQATWAVAYGLTVFGFSSEAKLSHGPYSGIKRAWKLFIRWIKQFLP